MFFSEPVSISTRPIMDQERHLRTELMSALSHDFFCFEHVPVRHATFVSKVLQADVIAVPKDPDYFGLTFAFEVKNPHGLTALRNFDVPFWTRTIHQASDYVYASIEARSPFEALQGRRVSSAFVYPTTSVAYRPRHGDESAEHLLRIWGAFEVAVHSRVGKASWETVGNLEKGRLKLWLGNEVWRSDTGYQGHAQGILRGRRRLGSQKVDLFRELDGIDVSQSS